MNISGVWVDEMKGWPPRALKAMSDNLHIWAETIVEVPGQPARYLCELTPFPHMTATEALRREAIIRDRSHPAYPQWAKDADARVLAIENDLLEPIARRVRECLGIDSTDKP